MSILYILLALLVFGVLIFVHELGHFLAARACGVGILEFAIGMGPKIFSKKSKKSGTVYSLRLFPIGGYVSMLGENGMEAVQGENGIEKEEKTPFVLNSDEETEKKEEHLETIDPALAAHAYCNQSVWKRILISLAGPFMNVLLGFLLMIGIVWASGSDSVGTTTVGAFHVQYTSETVQEGGLQNGDYLSYIKDVDSDAQAVAVRDLNGLREMIERSETDLFEVGVERMGANGEVQYVKLENISITPAVLEAHFQQSLSAQKLQIGDEVIKVNGTRVHTAYELAYEVMNQGHKPISFTVLRNGERVTLDAVQIPTVIDPASNTVFGDVDFKVYPEDGFGVGTVLRHAWYRSTSTVKMVYDSLVGLFSGRYGVEAVSGPVGITKTISDAAQTGILNLIYLVTVISINLGVMNLLPFPALDGGHLLLYLIEIVRRKPVKKEVEGIINFVGLVILLALAVLIAIKDIIAL